MLAPMLAVTNPADWAVYAVGAVFIIAGAIGVVALRNPVHCALMLVITLFGIALEFIDESADFLAAVQIIVYAGAVVILFLFVIMFLGVDRKESIGREPHRLQKPLAILIGIGAIIELLLLSRIDHWASGAPAQAGALNGPGQNIQKLGQSLYTGYLLPFEMTAALLVIAVVAAVVLSRRHHRSAGEMSAADQEDLMSGPTESPDAPAEWVGAASQTDLGEQQ